MKLNYEQANELFDWLQGKGPIYPVETELEHPLSAEDAFSVIYALQEKYGLIPDSFEMCMDCKELIDDLKRLLFEEHVCPALLQGILFKEAHNVNRTVEVHSEILEPLSQRLDVEQCAMCGRPMDGYYHSKDCCDGYIPSEDEIRAAQEAEDADG